MSNIPVSRILTLVFTDLVDSTALKTRFGDQQGGDLIARHRAIISTLAAESAGRIIDWTGDGCFLTFETPSAAAGFALLLQRAHAKVIARAGLDLYQAELAELRARLAARENLGASAQSRA